MTPQSAPYLEATSDEATDNRKKPRRLKGLRSKINLAILLASILVGLLALALLYPLEQTRRGNRLQNIHDLLVAVYQQNRERLANEIFAQQWLALANTLKGLTGVKHIAGAAVFDLEGRTLQAVGAHPRRDLAADVREALVAAPRYRRIVLEDHPYAEFTTRIESTGEKVGFCRLYYDLTEMEQEWHNALILLVALILAALLVLGWFLNLMLNRTVISPASLLRDAIQRVRAGKLGETVAFDTADEIGEIAADFNAMSTRLLEQHRALTDAVEAKDGFARDLMESNRQMAELNARLEERVEARTSELKRSYEQLELEILESQHTQAEKRRLEERLARSQKMEALGLLAGGVAHDLNNVLSGIVSYPDLLLLQLPKDSALYQPIKTIRTSGRRAAAIVQDLLTLARRGVVSMEVIELNRHVVQPYLHSPEHAHLMAAHPDIRIETHLTKESMAIRGSTVHLTKALMNLMANAAEAHKEAGNIRLSTESRYLEQPLQGYEQIQAGGYAILRVEDEGVGIAPEDLNRIFEPFYTKKVLGRSGTGLGMAVVWGTVQDHGGHINVRSQLDRGTRFEIYLPLSQETLAATRQRTPIDTLRGRGQTVLIVDDVPEQREITSSILRQLGYAVAAVPSGEAALEYLEKQPVDVIVLDMIMDPGMDGLDTYRAILRVRPDQKAVIASGFAENERVREAQRIGAGPFVRKPFTLEKIGQAILSALNRQS